MDILIIILLISILVVVININHKIPKRDYVREALEKESKIKNEND